MKDFILFLCLLIPLCHSGPSVLLPYVKLFGLEASGIQRFTGIPYSQPLTWRFTEGKPINESQYKKGYSFQADKHGKICPQEPISSEMSEECLNLDVSRPSNANPNSKMPVMVWIYGGGFLGGSIKYANPTLAMNYSNKLGLPFIHVAMNYRLNAFGFLCGKEMAVQGLCNLGLRDQRLALKWVKKYISFFGGDPDKVTIYGESAGSISVALHLTAFGASKETDLFRAGISESGSSNSLVIPNYNFFQQVYDTIVSKARCSKSSDTLECLRKVPFATLFSITKSIPNFGLLRWPFGPTVDGDLIPDVPFRLLKQGKFVRIPLLIGDNLDEGTTFVQNINWYSTQKVKDVIKGTWTNITQSSLDKLMTLYPDVQSEGSPYNTGDRPYYGKQGKRAASIYGDLCFVAPRRYLIEQISNRGVPVWTYRFEYNLHPNQINDPKYLGVAHGFDVYSVYYLNKGPSTDAIAAYWPAFASSSDPNVGLKGLPIWNRWDNISFPQIRFQQDSVVMKEDTFRKPASDFVNSILEEMLGEPLPSQT